MWGVDFSYSVGLVGRRGAALFAANGIMLFAARNAGPLSTRSAFVSGFVFGCSTLAVLGVFKLANGHVGLGILSVVLVEVTFALAFLFL